MLARVFGVGVRPLHPRAGVVRCDVAWLARDGNIAPLQVAWNTRGEVARPLEDDHRLAVLRRLLHDEKADPRDRLAGCLLLLYAQPLTRTAALETSGIALNSEGRGTITLARGAIELPQPLGSVALKMRDQRLEVTRRDGWLMAGRHAGTHVTAEYLRQRLKRYGITSRPGRHAALLALGARLPAPILAERSASKRALPNGYAPRAPPTPTTSRCGARLDRARGAPRSVTHETRVSYSFRREEASLLCTPRLTVGVEEPRRVCGPRDPGESRSRQ